MIITRTPFRISFAGGGSDLPAFYRKEPGAVLSTTIDKYMYIVIHPFFNKKKIQLKYSKTELVDYISDIQHPIFREVLGMYDLKGVDVNSIADIPAGTGMGSSSSFTVGLLNAVRAYIGKFSSAEKLASLACETEINRVGSPIGKQDQYAAAYGGINYITFYPDESVKVEKVLLSNSLKKQLEESLLLIHVGGSHSANEILQAQQTAISDAKKLDTQRKMVKMAEDLRKTLQKGNIQDFGMVLHEGWEMKRSLVSSISNNEIDDIYRQGLKAGALGGKLLGAGGAGFLLFYCPKEKQDYFRHEMHSFMEVEFRFDNFGSQVVYVGDKFIQ
ncbi:GHMP kinase, N-terminal domain protein [Hallella bergensis DSM 17361]|uniref:GHMP kinase, N-terminal domain protein n=1 Tax=Hallella bergensis DSM 17361 TaxID=585502 RepID=D1PXL8_9BACT|nr:GHMP kinase [Hallella bergensis]EFA43842.1 GHMP kinase, N-terminal domain protein [Hallella bergensis DSM 17361]